ncbi:hypothetical protein D5b_00242 [Faustovirus]|nr:hypothetical protein D5b_00242 [Faustovirus]AMN84672.1 hypothetical protein D6_00269 [Faustovirus]
MTAIWFHSSKIIIGLCSTINEVKNIRNLVFDALQLYPGQSRIILDYQYTIPNDLQPIVSTRIMPFGRQRYRTNIPFIVKKLIPKLSTLAAKRVADSQICIADISKLDFDSIDQVIFHELLIGVRYLFNTN